MLEDYQLLVPILLVTPFLRFFVLFHHYFIVGCFVFGVGVPPDGCEHDSETPAA